tara:strand:+ start:96 stop:410 length:315 start_codon:yes stop_codon:yes gene_type:complete
VYFGGGEGQAPRSDAVGARKRLRVGRVYVLGAAKYGHLEVLQWARANGCPWNKWTCAFAARHGHLEVLQWLRANGCPWDGRTRAVARDHLEVLSWAIANGCPDY